MASKRAGKPSRAPVDLDSIPPPEFWGERADLFDRLYAAQQEERRSRIHSINVTIPTHAGPDKVIAGESWVTTPMAVARAMSNSLVDKVFVARVDEAVLWDLQRPLEADCRLELLDWDHPEARAVFWHSSAHILGYAMERVYSSVLATGPALRDGGFFFEGASRAVEAADHPTIEAAMSTLVRAKEPFQRLVLKKEDMLKMFAYNPFKLQIIGAKILDGASGTVYRCGALIDLCRGPHLPDTGRCKAFAISHSTASFFQGESDKEPLQRVYAVAFPKADQLKEWRRMQEQAAKCDHRVLGRKQELFCFNDVSPACAFLLPHGARIFNALAEFQRRNYRKRGFEEVITPVISSRGLWETAGSWSTNKHNMFITRCDGTDFALAPMHHPAHCVLYAARPRSYRELPLRFVDFGVLHHNEIAPTMDGLFRTRSCHKDDGYVFCRADQLEGEVGTILSALRHIYDLLGLDLSLTLSTCCATSWSPSEQQLKSALNTFCGLGCPLLDVLTDSMFVYEGTAECRGKLDRLLKRSKADPAILPRPGWAPRSRPWELDAGGAFSGPTIDVVVQDALKRRHQCTTLYVDHRSPQRFGLKYTLPAAKTTSDEDSGGLHPDSTTSVAADVGLEANQERPLLLHCSVLGSIERLIAILCEHHGGRWPFWLSPRQVLVVPVSQQYQEYAESVRAEVFGEGFWADVDLSSNTLEKKIREAQLQQYNVILVVGKDEVDGQSVSVRTRDNQRRGVQSVAALVAWLHELSRTHSRDF